MKKKKIIKTYIGTVGQITRVSASTGYLGGGGIFSEQPPAGAAAIEQQVGRRIRVCSSHIILLLYYYLSAPSIWYTHDGGCGDRVPRTLYYYYYYI